MISETVALKAAELAVRPMVGPAWTQFKKVRKNKENRKHLVSLIAEAVERGVGDALKTDGWTRDASAKIAARAVMAADEELKQASGTRGLKRLLRSGKLESSEQSSFRALTPETAGNYLTRWIDAGFADWRRNVKLPADRLMVLPGRCSEQFFEVLVEKAYTHEECAEYARELMEALATNQRQRAEFQAAIAGSTGTATTLGFVGYDLWAPGDDLLVDLVPAAVTVLVVAALTVRAMLVPRLSDTRDAWLVTANVVDWLADVGDAHLRLCAARDDDSAVADVPSAAAALHDLQADLRARLLPQLSAYETGSLVPALHRVGALALACAEGRPSYQSEAMTAALAGAVAMLTPASLPALAEESTEAEPEAEPGPPAEPSPAPA